MDQAIRNKLRNVVTQCRRLLEESIAQVLQGQFGIYASGKKDEVHVEADARMGHLGDEDRGCRKDLLDHLAHIQALGYKPKDALGQLVREIAFTHLNRLCAYKMMEAREVWVGGQRFREALSRGLKSQGFLFYLAEHPEDEKLHNTGHQDIAYRHFLDWLGGMLSEEIGVLFSPTDPANRLYPPQRVLDDIIDLLGGSDIKPEDTELREQWPQIWSQDETIGWVYQYFTPKELRDQARKESAAPRNSYELAFRNQFFTPRYVVEFLTDNTLGRIWYEMRKGDTKLKDQCRYMVRRPSEVFLAEGESSPSPSGRGAGGEGEDLSQEELLKQPVYIPHRPKKDPRELKSLDPACGSGHFLLYCFDLLLTIYEEANADPDLGPKLQEDYPTLQALRLDVPRLVLNLAHNLHGIDTHHRHMEGRWYNFEPELGEKHDGLDRLVLKAEQRYTEVGSELAKHFVERFQKAKHPIKGVLRQVEVFESQVKPRLAEGKIAYVWVDALRFEMARELCEILRDFQIAIRPAIAAIPAITEIGMAALLPGAHQSAKVVPLGNGKVGLEIEGTVIKDRKDRIAFLKDRAGVPVFDAKLDDLLPKPSKKVRDGVENARLILITSQEIDELCEQDNITQARRQMDCVLNDLRRGIRVLGDLGVKTIVLAADHGHLFGEEISEDMKIEAPGGDAADLHRRVWVGIGGTVEPSYLRTSPASLGTDSELDIATPWTFACFKSKGGARAYFHGGLSPQELVIPVVVLVPTAQALAGPPTGIDWGLTPGSPRLTTRFFSVQIAGIGTGLFELEPPKVRVEIRAKGKCVSMPVSASYGYENATGEVALRVLQDDPKKIEPNTVTLMLVEEPSQKTVGICLVDANSGAELKTLDKIEVAVSL